MVAWLQELLSWITLKFQTPDGIVEFLILAFLTLPLWIFPAILAISLVLLVIGIIFFLVIGILLAFLSLMSWIGSPVEDLKDAIVDWLEDVKDAIVIFSEFLYENVLIHSGKFAGIILIAIWFTTKWVFRVLVSLSTFLRKTVRRQMKERNSLF